MFAISSDHDGAQYICSQSKWGVPTGRMHAVDRSLIDPNFTNSPIPTISWYISILIYGSEAKK